MAPRAKAAIKAKEPVAASNSEASIGATQEAEPQPPSPAAVVNGKKRSISQDVSPEESGSQQSSDLSEAEDGSQPSQASSRKRARTAVTPTTTSNQKAHKAKTAPTRTSKRTATKAATKESKAKETKATKTKGGEVAKTQPAAKAPRPKKDVPPSLNLLPGVPTHLRPPMNIFVQGTGDFGQLGLGVDTLGPIKRPRLHVWFKEAIEKGELGGESAGVEKVAVGGMHNLVIDEAGRVWSWGINDGAALGRITAGRTDPTTGENIDADVFESSPGQITDLIEANFRAVYVAASDSIGLALSDKGELRIWGSFRSSEGLLGFDGKPGSPKFQFSPIVPHALKNLQFVQAACGADHVIALTTEGHVYTWGDPRQKAIGRRVLDRHVLNGLDPERLAIREIVHVATGNWHSFAMDVHGTVYGWGLNSMGQLGIVRPRKGASEEEVEAGDVEFEAEVSAPKIVDALLPENLGNGRRVTMISGGEHHTLFLISDGSVYACGRCESGQLGLADDHPAVRNFLKRNAAEPNKKMEFLPIPTRIFFPPAPTEEDKDPALGPYAPAKPGAAPQTPIVHISAASRHNMAVSKEGVVYGWGYGNVHQLGMGDEEEQRVPARVKSAAVAGWAFEEAHSGGSHCLLVARREGPTKVAPAARVDVPMTSDSQ
ncbi:hypothetical protein FRB96_002686 [Tulasnella sp. 330]|nr:hypothetical protein FRB96_002686 [Tulasnella sp. 330]